MTTLNPAVGQSWYRVGYDYQMQRMAAGRRNATIDEVQSKYQIKDLDLLEFFDGAENAVVDYTFEYMKSLILSITPRTARSPILSALLDIAEGAVE